MLSRRSALLLVAGGLTGLSLPRVPPARESAAAPAAGPSVRAQVEGLLAARARAMLQADQAGLLAGTAPSARSAQREALDRMAQLPLAELSYRITSVTELADGIRITADLAYRLQGVDDYPAVLGRKLDLVRGPVGWLLAGDGSAGAPALWDLGPVRMVRGRHSLVLGLGEQAGLADLATLADRAVPAVSAVWGDGWVGRLLLESASTEAQFAQLLDVTADAYQGIAAVTVAAADAPVRTGADRVLVNPDAFRGLSDLGRRVVITHESTHVATRADTKAWTPLWLSEGVADFTGYRDTGLTARQIAPELAKDVTAGRLPSALPADVAFTAGADGIAQAYELGWLACDLIARRFGVQRLVAFYRAVGAAGAPTAAEGRDGQLDRLMRSQLGVGLAEFTRLWIDEATALAG